MICLLLNFDQLINFKALTTVVTAFLVLYIFNNMHGILVNCAYISSQMHLRFKEVVLLLTEMVYHLPN